MLSQIFTKCFHNLTQQIYKMLSQITNLHTLLSQNGCTKWLHKTLSQNAFHKMPSINLHKLAQQVDTTKWHKMLSQNAFPNLVLQIYKMLSQHVHNKVTKCFHKMLSQNGSTNLHNMFHNLFHKFPQNAFANSQNASTKLQNAFTTLHNMLPQKNLKSQSQNQYPKNQ